MLEGGGAYFALMLAWRMVRLRLRLAFGNLAVAAFPKSDAGLGGGGGDIVSD